MSQTDRNRRYSQRQVHRAAALQSGSTWLDVLAATVSADGTELVVITLDGARYAGKITLDPSPDGPEPVKGKRVFVPKSWDADIWNENVRQIQAHGYTKEEVLKFVTDAANKKADTDPDALKRAKHLEAVLNALPDAPDWYASLPLAKIS